MISLEINYYPGGLVEALISESPIKQHSTAQRSAYCFFDFACSLSIFSVRILKSGARSLMAPAQRHRKGRERKQ